METMGAIGGICCDPRRTAKRAGAEMAAAKGQGRAIFFVGIRLIWAADVRSDSEKEDINDEQVGLTAVTT